MKAAQWNKMDGYRASLALLDKATETSAIPGFAVKCAAFSKKVDDIVALITDQAKATEGKVAERDRVFGVMITAVLALAGVLRSHAGERELSDLLATVWVNPSDFKIRHADKVVLAQEILDAAKPLVGELALFGITVESLAAVQAKIDAAKDALPLPRAAIADRKAATERLAVAFRAADTFREVELEPLLLQIKETNPQFYAKYLARRRVKRASVRSENEDDAEKTGVVGDSIAPAVEGEKCST